MNPSKKRPVKGTKAANYCVHLIKPGNSLAKAALARNCCAVVHGVNSLNTESVKHSYATVCVVKNIDIFSRFYIVNTHDIHCRYGLL